MHVPWGPSDALLVVDVQNDFCPDGSLPIPAGDDVVDVLNEWLDDAVASGVTVVASRDWHPQGHVSFAERGGPWPPHCIRETPGASFHPDLHVPAHAIVVSKGAELDRDAYSAFDGTGLAEQLRTSGVKRVWVGGLAEDVCVHATVLDALRESFEVMLIEGGSKPVTEEGGKKAVAEMLAAGARQVGRT